MAQRERSRKVIERIFMTGHLVLETPASFGNGDAEGASDIPLLYDTLDPQRPLLTGASIAGALRNYLREYDKGFGWSENRKADVKSRAERLFGHLDDYTSEGQPERRSTWQSWLMIDDALGTSPVGDTTEIRPGVAINPQTRAYKTDKAGKGQLYDIELLAAGTSFPLHFEFWLTKDNQDLLEALAIALDGLEQGQIGLGMRKRRGLGRCRVTAWDVKRFNMSHAEDVIQWLSYRRPPNASQFKPGILGQLGFDNPRLSTAQAFTVEARFSLDSSLLIRSATGQGDAPDMVHLRSRRPGATGQVDQPILSGTSLAGAIRSRALRIANTVLTRERGAKLVEGMFGRGPADDKQAGDDGSNEKKQPIGSRVVVHETDIEARPEMTKLVQNRVKIDRFTGGAYPQALFSEQPVFGTRDCPTYVIVKVALRQPYDLADDKFKAEVGLLLLVLKDLWTGDLPLGGEASVGRGRLQGVEAKLSWNGKQWHLTQTAANAPLQLSGDPKDTLETCVKALREWTYEPTNS